MHCFEGLGTNAAQLTVSSRLVVERLNVLGQIIDCEPAGLVDMLDRDCSLASDVELPTALLALIPKEWGVAPNLGAV